MPAVYVGATIMGIVCIGIILYRYVKTSQRRIAASIPGVAFAMCEYHLGTISGMYIGGEDFDGIAAKKLIQLKFLKELQLDYTGISDRDLQVLRKLPRLRSFWLYDKKISDEGVAIISELKHLRSLSLRLQQVSSDGFRKLARLKQLRRLEVDIRMLDDSDFNFVKSQLQKCDVVRV